MPIPAFGPAGVLPPFLHDPIGHARSPYPATIEEVALRFATSHQRRAILDGVLQYRKELKARLGIASGIQWLDGSFVENVEALEKRSPNDVDVLTVAAFPPRSQLDAAQRELLDPKYTKKAFRCDAYPLNTAAVPNAARFMDHVTYWFGLFGHRRDGTWKGLIAVPLDPDADARALALIAGAP